MARPQKNSCDYFTHDNGMRNHRKIKSIRNKFGIQGYAIWCMLLEYLTASDGNEFEYSEIEIELLSGDFGVSVTEIRDVIDYCIRLELLFNKDGFIYSESLNERLAPVYKKRGVAKEISAKQKRINGKFAENSRNDGVSVTEMPQIKVNKIKVNNNSSEIPDFVQENRESAMSFNEQKITREIASDVLVKDSKVQEMFSRNYKLSSSNDIKRIIDEWVFQADLKDSFPMTITKSRSYLQNWTSVKQGHDPSFFKPKNPMNEMTFAEKIKSGMLK